MKIYRFEDLAQFQQYDFITDCISLIRHAVALSEPPHGHDYYEIEYICKGSGVQVINGIPYPVEAGSIMFFGTTDVHSYYSLQDMSVYNCCFTRKELLHYFPSEALSSPVVHLDPYFRPQVEQLFNLLEAELKNKRHQYLEAAWLLLDLILLSMFRNEASPVTKSTYWAPLLAEIATHYKYLTLSDAAKIMDISTRHFCRRFKKDFNCTFHEYIKTIRIQQSKRLLLYSSKNVGEILESVGYSNSCSFFQDFKQIVGVTPHQYRLNAQKLSANDLTTPVVVHTLE